MDHAELQGIFTRDRERFLEEWKSFLRFRSISADPAFAGECRACAEWLRDHLRTFGLESSLLETNGKPVVFARRNGRPGTPTIVFYGHYDVQPADPLDLWASDPFEPTLRNGRLYARGAQDNKGQVMYFLKALQTLLAAGALDCGIRIFIEGEEESSSSAMTEGLARWREELRGDVLLVCDTGTPKTGQPAITMGLRGIVHLTATLSGLKKDLHSGVHGGIAPNPATAMARLVATLHRPDGRIAVEGYYDGVQEPSAEDRALANVELLSAAEYEQLVGVVPSGGEEGYTFAERRGFRPTIEVNGIHSGYDGPGSKTIIPARAMVKITSRVVGGQDPERCLALLSDHLRRHAPASLKLEITEASVGGPALLLSSRAKSVALARRVLEEITDQPVLFLWEGASIPIVAGMAKAAGAEPLLVGFGTEEDDIHAPNESFSLEQFRQGFLYAGLILGALSREWSR